jgi:hippurate hydrolase
VEVTVTITGKSVHISKWSEGIDAMAAGAEFLRRAYAMMAQLPPVDRTLLRFGKLVSGTVRNAVSGHTLIEGTLRTYSEESSRFCCRQLQEIGKAVAAETGCGVTLDMATGYPAVWNHEELLHSICQALGEEAPRLLETPALASEDFSFYQQEVPGAFFFLGVGETSELHAPDFSFNDEAVLPAGVEFMKKLLML